ncbi:peptide chain release factor N(5)-glutamine methyltransferase [Halomonas huangheensis]|uniref:Release factor glutamine methyltransferase n=1 Tax=Halomonas huangheensis TaxID=1178482 RepID=W1NC65_9GAMM|nr:peptide chain release factor N(5)-glutamine methyltransferase [Halomonas huangheensis]ALM52999.1 protein-(glutamine-N5) methyltransferase, release factor-specific [Halomonas huangheensis]ERL53073.1 hypothetical protein BJB45_17510 [Halomonas huangheensis]
MRIDMLVARTASRLQEAGSPTPRLDAEVLAMHVLQVDRAWLYTWGDRLWETWQRARFEALVAARCQGKPVAYLTGEREFWGLALETSPCTLIPRPDTETLVEAALTSTQAESGELLDLGTGTGAIALAFACERPQWRVTGVDVSAEAIALAKRNAVRHNLEARFLVSDWFAAVDGQRFDLIVSNPPYIDAEDPHLVRGDVRHEPRSALVAADQGLSDIRHIVRDARSHLREGGWLMIEHGYGQAEVVRGILNEHGYYQVISISDLGGNDRVSVGCTEARNVEA